MNDFRINHIRNKGEIVSLYDLLLKFMARIYMSTNGKYPALEWLKPKEKPDAKKKNFLKDFKNKYGPFLRWRLTEELDEIYLAFDKDRLIGVIALNHKLEGKKIPWVPKEYMKRNDVGFIELFAVDPEYRGQGIGRLLFLKALKRLEELGKRPCVVTFTNLEAVAFYEKMGGKKEKEYGEYILYCF